MSWSRDEIRRRAEERETLIRCAAEYVNRLSQRVGPLSAVVHGSVARGDFNIWSDVDVLVVCDCLPDHPLKRLDVLFSDIISPVEPKGFTVGEFHIEVGKGNRIIADSLIHGIVIRDDLNLFNGRRMDSVAH